ncbi:hypothetical protein [Pelagerythrobacter aerophilus]|uniref:Uncharacterized protein n=1 Tax=Pelagerythrobacter aerophilus TaxID=2306995 RepID=A0A418NFN3_9SPHN|nr:hypothetical protein [Pelagerythrobacter aerophilus]RIV76916.1 hypothetical protein D2V04_12350 [Pelagerythrobacter aerophilus]
MASIWGVAVILGPILLLAVAIYVWARNRQAGPRSVEQSERGARELREDLEERQDRTIDL